jgi:putative transposase
MREEGFLAAPRKRFKVTTHSEHILDIAKNMIDRQFSIKTPNTVWATDITYVRTWEGWLYLAVFVDLFSRRVVGWSMATHMRTEGALGALNMALGPRRPAHKCIITVTEKANTQAMTMAMRFVPITSFAA